jgi:carnitine O-acetyltransferase
VVENGYGLSYSIHDDHIRWCITTKNNDAEKFANALTQAANDLKGMMDRAKAAGGDGEKAKA